MRRSEFFTMQLMAYLTIALMSLPGKFSDTCLTTRGNLKKTENNVAVVEKKAPDFKNDLLFRYL
jgi:hypothetical protein